MAPLFQPFDWRSLLEPYRFIFGTPAGDALMATAEGDVLLGLGGDDTLESDFNRTALFGGSGDDALTTTIAAEPAANLHLVTVQDGGNGEDTLRADLSLGGPIFSDAGGVTAEFWMSGGAGQDLITVRADLGTNRLTTVTAHVEGGGGSDEIDVQIGHFTADSDGGGSGSAENMIHGGGGDDHIRAVAADLGEELTPAFARNVITGDCGDDVIDALALARNLDAEFASNSLKGGQGDDVLRATADMSTLGRVAGLNELWGSEGNDFLSATIKRTVDGPTEATNFLDGGSGNDTLRASTDDRGSYQLTAVNRLRGDSGDDDLTAETKADTLLGSRGKASNLLDAGSGDDALKASLEISTWVGFDAVNSLDAGRGDDALTASIAISSFDVSGISALNALTGGDGDDTLTAGLKIIPYIESQPLLAENRLAGGAGSDVLVGVVADGSPGASILNGGRGGDQLTVIGGTANRLDGGSGRDTLNAGSGDDFLSGGEGLDAFRFDLASDQGTDTLLDFDAAREIIRFTGLIEAGAPGLADDLDRISAVTDGGPGQDVVVSFDSGTMLVFKGLGTGLIANWTQLVSDPASQLLLDPILA